MASSTSNCLKADAWPSWEEPEEDSGSDEVMDQEVYKYKVRMRSKALPGRWQRIVKVA